MHNQPPLEHPTAQNAKAPMKTWRILFLDEAERVEKLKAACLDGGYVVVGATTVKEAWAFLDGKDHADVIVCAAHLEEESMFEFLKGVRASEVHRNSKFLILSLEPGTIAARMDRIAARTGVVLGADSFVIMPVFDPAELIENLKRLQPVVPKLQQSGSAEEKRRAD